MLGCRVTQAIGRMKRKGQPELERLKRRLEQVYENRGGMNVIIPGLTLSPGNELTETQSRRPL